MSISETEEFRKVHEHIEKALPQLHHAAAGNLPYSTLSVTCGQLYSGVVYGWDNCLMGIRYAAAGQSQVLADTVGNLLHYQHSTGYVPNILTDDGPCASHWHAQPYLAQSVAICLAADNKMEWAKSLYEKLTAYIDYYFKFFSMPGGLLRWENQYKSGIDNELVGCLYPPEQLIAPDINALMYLELRAMHYIAQRLGLESKWDKRAEKLKQAINDYLWNEEEGCYGTRDVTCDEVKISWIDLEGGSTSGKYAFVSSPALLVLYAGVATDERAKRMIENYVLSPKHFRSQWGIRSLSKSSAYINNAKWGCAGKFDPIDRICNSNWQGPVWTPLCWFAFQGLMRYGYQDEAEKLTADVMHLLSRSLDKFGGWSENYNEETGDNLEADNFFSWNILMDLLPGFCKHEQKLRIFF